MKTNRLKLLAVLSAPTSARGASQRALTAVLAGALVAGCAMNTDSGAPPAAHGAGEEGASAPTPPSSPPAYVPSDEEFRAAAGIDASDPALHSPRPARRVALAVTPADEGALPSGLSDVLSAANDAAGIISNFAGAAGVIQGVIGLFASSTSPDTQLLSEMNALEGQMNQLFSAINATDWSIRSQVISTQLGNAQAAAMQLPIWAENNAGLANPVLIPQQGTVDNDSLLAVATLIQSGYWTRPANPQDYASWPPYLPQRAAVTNGEVWDYRMIVPALMTAMNTRLDVMAAMHPGFQRDGYFAPQIAPVRTQLMNAVGQMQNGIVCGSGLQLTNVTLNPTMVTWGLLAQCGDIYSGALSPVQMVNPSYSTAPPTGETPFVSATAGASAFPALRAQLGAAEGLPAIVQFIDTLSWYMDPWQPLWINRLAVGYSYGLYADDLGADDQLWSYDPVLNRLRSGVQMPGGVCMRNLTTASTPNTFAPGLEAASCPGAVDPTYAATFGDMPPSVSVGGVCLGLHGLNGAGLPQVTGQPCVPGAPLQAAGWKKLDAGNGQVAQWTAQRADIVNVNGSGSPEYTWWDPLVSGAWQRGPDLPGANLPGGAAVAVISRMYPHIDVFAVTSTGSVVLTWRDPNVTGGAWQGWFPIMPPGTAPPGAPITVVSQDTKTLDVFVAGNAGAVWTASWTSAGSWAPAKAVTASGLVPKGASIAAVSRGRGSLDVFAENNSGGVTTATWSTSKGWATTATPVFANGTLPAGAQLAADSRLPGEADLFAVDVSGAVQSSWSAWTINNGAWAGQFPVMPAGSATPGGSLSAVTRSENNVDVFATGPGNRVVTTWWSTSANWPETAMTVIPPGSPFPGRVFASSRYTHHIDLYRASIYGDVQQAWWDAGNSPAAPWVGPNALPVQDVIPIVSTCKAQTCPTGQTWNQLMCWCQGG